MNILLRSCWIVSSEDRYKEMMKPKESVHEMLIESDNANVSDNTSIDLKTIPVAKKKASIRDTHKTKAFYIRNDIAKQIDKDIRNSKRGAMTEIVNALFKEYYKSQGRL